MRARLEVLRGAKTQQQVSLRLPTVVGRGREANLKLPAATVSRHHCELYEYDGQLVVRDLGSANGTVVNGHKIMGPTFLTVDDELTVGPVTMRLTALPPTAATSDPTSVMARSELEGALPDLPELAEADSVLPVTAAASDGGGHSEEPGEDSELRYAESPQPGHSFLGIVSSHEDGKIPAVDSGTDDPSSPPAVAPDDSALSDFLKRMDP